MKKGAHVRVTSKECRGDVSRMIKRFIKKAKKLGIIDEVKDRRHYKKPSEKRREAIKRSIARRKKEAAKRAKNN